MPARTMTKTGLEKLPFIRNLDFGLMFPQNLKNAARFLKYVSPFWDIMH